MFNIYFKIFGFVVCATVIDFSGIKLTKYGDKIAELTGWGKAWVLMMFFTEKVLYLKTYPPLIYYQYLSPSL